MRVVAGLDLSLTSSGVAMSDGTCWRIPSKGKASASLDDRSVRLRRLAQTIVDCVVRADLVVIESPAYSRTMGSMHDRSGLWWLVVSRLHDEAKPVAEVAPSARCKFACGKGNAGKDEVMLAAAKRYAGWNIDGNDVADAVVLAAMGARHLGVPMEDSLPLANLAAMEKVRWP